MWLEVKSEAGHSEKLAQYFQSHHGVIWEKQTKSLKGSQKKRNGDAASIMRLYRPYAKNIDMHLQILADLKNVNGTRVTLFCRTLGWGKNRGGGGVDRNFFSPST